MASAKNSPHPNDRMPFDHCKTMPRCWNFKMLWLSTCELSCLPEMLHFVEFFQKVKKNSRNHLIDGWNFWSSDSNEVQMTFVMKPAFEPTTLGMHRQSTMTAYLTIKKIDELTPHTKRHFQEIAVYTQFIIFFLKHFYCLHLCVCFVVYLLNSTFISLSESSERKKKHFKRSERKNVCFLPVHSHINVWIEKAKSVLFFCLSPIR